MACRIYIPLECQNPLQSPVPVIHGLEGHFVALGIWSRIDVDIVQNDAYLLWIDWYLVMEELGRVWKLHASGV